MENIVIILILTFVMIASILAFVIQILRNRRLKTINESLIDQLHDKSIGHRTIRFIKKNGQTVNNVRGKFNPKLKTFEFVTRQRRSDGKYEMVDVEMIIE